MTFAYSVGGKNLVVRADGIGLPRAVEAALGLVDVVLRQRGAHVLQAQCRATAMAAGLIWTRTAGF